MKALICQLCQGQTLTGRDQDDTFIIHKGTKWQIESRSASYKGHSGPDGVFLWCWICDRSVHIILLVTYSATCVWVMEVQQINKSCSFLDWVTKLHPSHFTARISVIGSFCNRLGWRLTEKAENWEYAVRWLGCLQMKEDLELDTSLFRWNKKSLGHLRLFVLASIALRSWLPMLTHMPHHVSLVCPEGSNSQKGSWNINPFWTV